jgi:hypothetical protein
MLHGQSGIGWCRLGNTGKQQQHQDHGAHIGSQ